MTALSKPAFVGARGIDAVQIVDAPHAAALKASGIDFAIQYLGSVTAVGVQSILNAGLAFMAVTYADKFDGATCVAECQAIGYPVGATVWLDVEGVASADPTVLKGEINAWAAKVAGAGYIAGLYVGAGCPLTGPELYALAVTRYWHSLSRVAEPDCGFCLHQLYPSVMWAGVWADINFVQSDYRQRLPTWAIKGP